MIDVASLHQLEARLIEAGLNPAVLWRRPQDWNALSRYVEPWISETAEGLAKASLSICSVIYFEAILIVGAFPDDVRQPNATSEAIPGHSSHQRTCLSTDRA